MGAKTFTPNVWRVDEEVQWRAFFSGERAAPPEGRSLPAARKHLGVPSLGSCYPFQRHSMTIAAARHLPNVPYTGTGSHRKFIDDVCRLAIKPEALASRVWPDDVFSAAVADARRALAKTLWFQNRAG